MRPNDLSGSERSDKSKDLSKHSKSSTPSTAFETPAPSSNNDLGDNHEKGYPLDGTIMRSLMQFSDKEILDLEENGFTHLTHVVVFATSMDGHKEFSNNFLYGELSTIRAKTLLEYATYVMHGQRLSTESNIFDIVRFNATVGYGVCDDKGTPRPTTGHRFSPPSRSPLFRDEHEPELTKKPYHTLRIKDVNFDKFLGDPTEWDDWYKDFEIDFGQTELDYLLSEETPSEINDDDNRALYGLLEKLTKKGSVRHVVIPFRETKDGRGAWLALHKLSLIHI